MAETRSITTPIYYVNAHPHIGHVYTSTVCDVYARFERFLGRDVFFLTGTDEHGQKVETSAREQGISPSELADRNSAVFRDVLDLFSISNDDFIRTTDAHHEQQVQFFVQRLIDRDAIYLGEFEGWYDKGQEEYYTETKARELEYKSPISGQDLVRATEQNYYFRLSSFQDRIEQLYEEQPDFVRPQARRNEMLGRLREGLNDVPISRTNFSWGIPVPGNEEHVIYVWIDALFNYVTALGLGLEEEPEENRSRFWPADYHIVGKEILWFHSVIWPAVLMALDLPLPRCIYAHSFWISEGQKMSKSLGNFIDLESLEGYCNRYGGDALRWYLVTQGPLGATDADFSRQHFHDVYTTDLVNTIGNCTSRVSAMIGKYFDGLAPADPDPSSDGWPESTAAHVEACIASMEEFDLVDSCEQAMAIIRRVDVYINEKEPFKLAKNPDSMPEVGGILYRCAEALRIASCLLAAAIPERMEALWSSWNLDIDPGRGNLQASMNWGGLAAGTKIEKVALFPRLELDDSTD